METLAEALPKEQQRVRDLLPMYDAIPTGIDAMSRLDAIKTLEAEGGDASCARSG